MRGDDPRDSTSATAAQVAAAAAGQWVRHGVAIKGSEVEALPAVRGGHQEVVVAER
jgi:hypothetical protein